MPGSRDAIRHCLVTGGAGFIGSHLVEQLLMSGYQVTVLDNLSSGKLENLNAVQGQFQFLQGDIKDFETVLSVAGTVDAIFHEAAVPSVYHSIVEPHETHQVNVDGTVNVLEAAHRTGVKKVIMASSAAVYGADASLPKSEAMPVKPVSPYGLHKLVLEQYGEMYARQYGLDVTCFRYFNVYGTRQDPKSQYSGVISIFMNAILSGQNPVIYGDGGQSRDFVSVLDICQANLKALQYEGDFFQVYNVGSGRAHTLLELLDALKRLSGQSFDILYQPERRGDLRHSLADITEAKTCLGYEPKQVFEAGLQQLMAYERAAAQRQICPSPFSV